jgi:SHAQKYF class myb-like DNA-binding protein
MTDEINFQPADEVHYVEHILPISSRKDSYRTTTEENESLGEDNTQDSKYSTGRWSQEEHNKFIEAMFFYGNEWKRVQQHIKSRSSTQARSHAQKFFIRLKKRLIEENLDHEITSKPIGKRNEIIMSWIQENVTSDIAGVSRDYSFYIEKRDKLCKIIMNLISNPIKRKASPKAIEAKRKEFGESDMGCMGIESEPFKAGNISATTGVTIKRDDLVRCDPFKLSFCNNECICAERNVCEEINNFDLDYFFGDNYKN